MLVGLAVNWIMSLYVLMTEEYAEVDFMGFVLTIPIWPYTLYEIIAAFFNKE